MLLGDWFLYELGVGKFKNISAEWLNDCKMFVRFINFIVKGGGGLKELKIWATGSFISR